MVDYLTGKGNPDSDAAKAKNAPTWTTQGTQEMANVHQVDDTPGDDLMRVPLIDPNAYKNPVGSQAGAWKTAAGNFLGATTGAAPQIANTNTYGGAQMDQGQYNQSWNEQWKLANQLGAMAQGQGPSMAQVQAQQSQQQALQNQMAMLGAQRGASNPAMAAYQAQQLGAQQMQQAAQQAVAGRTQEQMAALQAQGQLLGGMNEQAQQFAGNQSQLTQQAQLASMGALNQTNAYNTQAQMAQQSLNAQQYNNYMQMLNQQAMAEWQAKMAYEQQQASNYLVAAGIEKDLSIQQAQQNQAWAGAGASMASGLIGVAADALSDQTSKKNIKSGKEQLNSLLEKVYQSSQFKKMTFII